MLWKLSQRARFFKISPLQNMCRSFLPKNVFFTKNVKDQKTFHLVIDAFMKESFKNVQKQNYQPHFEQGFGDNTSKTQFLPTEFSSSRSKKAQKIAETTKTEQLHPRLRLTQQEAWKKYLDKLETL